MGNVKLSSAWPCTTFLLLHLCLFVFIPLHKVIRLQIKDYVMPHKAFILAEFLVPDAVTRLVWLCMMHIWPRICIHIPLHPLYMLFSNGRIPLLLGSG